MVRCPTLQNTSLAYFETASRTKVFDTTATHRHIPTQQCRPRCWKLLRWSNLKIVLLVSLTPFRCLRRWRGCQSQAVGLGFHSNFRNGQRQLHVLRTILRERLWTWRLSTRTTLGPRRRGRQSHWEVSKVGGVCPLPVRKIQKLFWDRRLFNLSWWLRPGQWHQLFSMWKWNVSITRSQQRNLCVLRDWLRGHCRKSIVHSMWSWFWAKWRQESLHSMPFWLVCRVGVVKMTRKFRSCCSYCRWATTLPHQFHSWGPPKSNKFISVWCVSGKIMFSGIWFLKTSHIIAISTLRGPAPLSAIHAGKVPFQNRERVAVRCALDRCMHSLVMRFAESVLSHQWFWERTTGAHRCIQHSFCWRSSCCCSSCWLSSAGCAFTVWRGIWTSWLQEKTGKNYIPRRPLYSNLACGSTKLAKRYQFASKKLSHSPFSLAFLCNTSLNG